MAVKLRLMRMGKKKQPTYRVVAADSRSPRDGRFIEIVGIYDPRRPVPSASTTTRPSTGCARAPSPPSGCRSSSRSPARGSVQRQGAHPPGAGPTTASDKAASRAERHHRGRRRGRRDEVDDAAADTAGRRRLTTTPPRDEVPTAHAVLDHLVGSLVDDRDAVRIDVAEGRQPRLTVRVGPTDMGRVIGKRGRVAQAIRTVVRAAAARDGSDVEVEFEE